MKVYRCKDDGIGGPVWIYLFGLDSDRHWPATADAVGHPEWKDDPRFATTRSRGREHSVEMIRLFDEIMLTKTVGEWGEIFDAHDVWWVPVQRDHHVISDPQALANGSFVQLPPVSVVQHGTKETVRGITSVNGPVDFDGGGNAVRGATPELGENTTEVLRELGYSDEQVEAMLVAAARS